MKKPRSKRRKGERRHAVAVVPRVDSMAVDVLGIAQPNAAPAWLWRQGSARDAKVAAPSRRAKGPPPIARLTTGDVTRRLARAEAYQAKTRQLSTRLMLAPHLIALLADTAPHVRASTNVRRVDQWQRAARRVQALVLRERGAFAALVLPMVLLAAALLIDVSTGTQIKHGSIGQALAALDRQMLAPGPLVQAHALAKVRQAETSIIAALPEFSLVTAMPSIARVAPLIPEVAVALAEPIRVRLVPADGMPVELPEVALAPVSHQALEPAVPVLVSPILVPSVVALPRDVVTTPDVTAAASVQLPSRTSDAETETALARASLPDVALTQCQRSSVVSSADAARLAVSRVLAAAEPDDPLTFGRTLAAAAIAQVKDLSIYNAKYVTLSYPMGDVTTQFGVCSDVVIRAYRALNIDLQELVYLSRAGVADSNIDHRRTELLRGFFALHGEALPTSPYSEEYLPGDIVTYYRPQNKSSTAHIAIVTDEIAPSGRPMIVHNRGWGVQLEDALFVDQMTGHYRFRGLTAEVIASLPRSSRMANAAQRLAGRLAVVKVVKSTLPGVATRGVEGVASDQQVSGRVPRPALVATGNPASLPVPMGLGVKPVGASLR
ncbi:MAG: DUF1287 domain-containing protein [Hyphomicrobiaceae bacterium]